jgi:serine/threonine protein kinase
VTVTTLTDALDRALGACAAESRGAEAVATEAEVTVEHLRKYVPWMPDLPTAFTDAIRDRYVVEREIGAGGMATVHLARDVRHNRYVAIKVLKPEVAASLGAERFLKEIEIAARLTHPHIIPLHDSGEAAGFLFYVINMLRASLSISTWLPTATDLQRGLPYGCASRFARCSSGD